MEEYVYKHQMAVKTGFPLVKDFSWREEDARHVSAYITRIYFVHSNPKGKFVEISEVVSWSNLFG
jgi:hypothetical protein